MPVRIGLYSTDRGWEVRVGHEGDERCVSCFKEQSAAIFMVLYLAQEAFCNGEIAHTNLSQVFETAPRRRAARRRRQ